MITATKTTTTRTRNEITDEIKSYGSFSEAMAIVSDPNDPRSSKILDLLQELEDYEMHSSISINNGGSGPNH